MRANLPNKGTSFPWKKVPRGGRAEDDYRQKPANRGEQPAG